MASCFTIVRIRPKVDGEEELLAARPTAIAALKRHHPGLRRSVLLRGEDGALVDIIEWDSRAAAQAALAGAAELPGFSAWVDLVGELISYEYTEVLGD